MRIFEAVYAAFSLLAPALAQYSNRKFCCTSRQTSQDLAANDIVISRPRPGITEGWLRLPFSHQNLQHSCSKFLPAVEFEVFNFIGVV
jgi:hypothetical protein